MILGKDCATVYTTEEPEGWGLDKIKNACFRSKLSDSVSKMVPALMEATAQQRTKMLHR